MNEETNSLLGAKYRKSILREALTAMSHLYPQKPSIIYNVKTEVSQRLSPPFLAPDAQPLIHMFHHLLYVRAIQPVDNSINLTSDIQKNPTTTTTTEKTDVALRFTKLLKLFNK